MADGVGGRLKRFFASRDDVIAAEIMELMEERAHAHLIKGVYRPKELKGILAELDFLVGVPLHSLILATSAGVPVVGLCYLPKNPRFMKMIGQQALGIDIQDPGRPLDRDELVGKMADAWKRREQISHELDEKLAEPKRLACENAHYAAELLGS